MGLPFWQPADCCVQFDIDFVMKCWLIKYLSIYLSTLLLVPTSHILPLVNVSKYAECDYRYRYVVIY